MHSLESHGWMLTGDDDPNWRLLLPEALGSVHCSTLRPHDRFDGLGGKRDDRGQCLRLRRHARSFHGRQDHRTSHTGWSHSFAMKSATPRFANQWSEMWWHLRKQFERREIT